MVKKSTPKLNLSHAERKYLRRHKIKIQDILTYAPDELEPLLHVSPQRAKELHALAVFQQISSIGIKFAEDLIFLGFYSLDELAGEDGAKLTDAYEKRKGYRIDSCVEDQFRLAVYVANTQDYSKTWWDFTAERKQFRAEKGYPKDRPSREWHEEMV
ncbi:MAG: helix-hairpin-helix domain-containing protein [Bacteroidota bacterium]